MCPFESLTLPYGTDLTPCTWCWWSLIRWTIVAVGAIGAAGVGSLGVAASAAIVADADASAAVDGPTASSDEFVGVVGPVATGATCISGVALAYSFHMSK